MPGVGLTADFHVDASADAGFVAGAGGGRVGNRHGGLLSVNGQQRAEGVGSVAGGAAADVVGRIDQDHRAAGNFQRLPHGLIGGHRREAGGYAPGLGDGADFAGDLASATDVAVDGGHHTTTRKGRVGIGETAKDRDADDIFFVLETPGGLQRGAQRQVVSSGDLRGEQEIRLIDANDRRYATVQGLAHDLGGLDAALVGVDVGIGVERDDGISQLGHIGGDIAVQIHLDHHRDVGAGDFADPPQNVGLGVQQVVGDHGAVQHQQNAVQGQRGAQALDQFVGQVIVGVLFDGTARHGHGVEGGEQFPAVNLADRHHPGDPGAGAAHLLKHLPTPVENANFEVAHTGGDFGEGVGLVHDPAERDAGGLHGPVMRSGGPSAAGRWQRSRGRRRARRSWRLRRGHPPAVRCHRECCRQTRSTRRPPGGRWSAGTE